METSICLTGRSSPTDDDTTCEALSVVGRKMHNINLFPSILYKMLEDSAAEGTEHIISWMPCGKSFRIHNRREFISKVLPKYYYRINIRSFLRQLNLYCFEREKNKTEPNGYYGSYRHRFFRRSDPDLCSLMERRVKRRSKTDGNLINSLNKHETADSLKRRERMHKREKVRHDHSRPCIKPDDVNGFHTQHFDPHDKEHRPADPDQMPTERVSSSPIIPATAAAASSTTLTQVYHLHQCHGSSKITTCPTEEELHQFKSTLAMFLPSDEALVFLRRSPRDQLEKSEKMHIDQILSALEPFPVPKSID